MVTLVKQRNYLENKQRIHICLNLFLIDVFHNSAAIIICRHFKFISKNSNISDCIFLLYSGGCQLQQLINLYCLSNYCCNFCYVFSVSKCVQWLYHTELVITLLPTVIRSEYNSPRKLLRLLRIIEPNQHYNN